MLTICRECKELIEKALQELPSETKSGRCAPDVYAGWLPQTVAGEEKDNVFPFVLVRPQEGFDTRDSGFCTLYIDVGGYSKDDDGWIDVMNIVNRIRYALDNLPGGALPHGVIVADRSGHFIDWALYEEQAYPQWFARLKIHFETGRAQSLPGKDMQPWLKK